jgi:L-histidine N-alpha-methyltransferase
MFQVSPQIPTGFRKYDHLKTRMARAIAEDVATGLSAPQKSIPSKYFYDERGSMLFEEICRLPEYYPARTEISLLRQNSPSIVRSFGHGYLVELGSGSNWKIRYLIDALGPEKRSKTCYVPVDVSSSALEASAMELLRMYPNFCVQGLVADFTTDLHLLPDDRRKLILFLGSTIGNFDDAQTESFLRALSNTMRNGDRFLLGLDLVKPLEILEAAYNDSQQVTAEFNKNILHVVNRELDADFDLSDFEHLAMYVEAKNEIQMHLKAVRPVEVHIRKLHMTVFFEEGETILTEISRKFTFESAEKMLQAVDLKITDWRTDPAGWFAHAEIVHTNGG